MNAAFLDGYIKVSILIALVDTVLAMKSFQKNKTTGRFLGFACAGAAVVDVSYLISILNDDYLCMSVMSSVYFVTIDVMLLSLRGFTVYFTKGKFKKIGRKSLLRKPPRVLGAEMFRETRGVQISRKNWRRDVRCGSML